MKSTLQKSHIENSEKDNTLVTFPAQTSSPYCEEIETCYKKEQTELKTKESPGYGALINKHMYLAGKRRPN